MKYEIIMNVSLKVIVFLSGTIISVLCGNYGDQFIVDYYVDLIADRTQKALDYEFPKDARMHEPNDKVPKGKLQFVVAYSYSIICNNKIETR